MSSSNIQGLAGFSIYAAGQCRSLDVLEIDGQPRHCNSWVVVSMSALLVESLLEPKGSANMLYDEADKIRQGGWSALTRRHKSVQAALLLAKTQRSFRVLTKCLTYGIMLL